MAKAECILATKTLLDFHTYEVCRFPSAKRLTVREKSGATGPPLKNNYNSKNNY